MAESSEPPPAKRPRREEELAEKFPKLKFTDFDPETQKALEEIDGFQTEIEAVNELASEEILKIEQKYYSHRQPFFDKRAAFIAKVPNFWFASFSNHPDLSSLIEEYEEDCFHHLIKLEVEESEDIKSGYKIHFHFEENPYFENEVLTKTFQLESMGSPSSTSTTILWKEGMNIIQKNKGSEPRIEKARQIEFKSFFVWYDDNTDATCDTVAEIIKDDLWQNPLEYYLMPEVELENGANGDDEEQADAGSGGEGEGEGEGDAEGEEEEEDEDEEGDGDGDGNGDGEEEEDNDSDNDCGLLNQPIEDIVPPPAPQGQQGAA